MEGKLRKNIIYQLLYQILTVCTPLIVTPYISRVLGAKNIGIYSYTYSIAYYFVMFSMLGIMNYGNRTIASHNSSRRERSKIFWELYSMQLVMSVAMIVLYACYLFFICKYEVLISALQLLYVMTAFVDISWLFFGVENVRPVVVRNTIVKVLSLCGIFILVKSSTDLWIYAFLLNGGQLFGCITMWLSLRKFVDYYKPKISEITRHIAPNIALFIPVIAISVYKTMDKIMLGALSTDLQVGFYSNAENLINAPLGFIVAIGTVMLPRITSLLAEGNGDKGIIYLRKSLKLTMCFASAVSFGLIAVAPIFVPLYYGNGYEECIFLLQGQAIIMLFIAWANVIRTQYLLPHKMDKQYIWSIISGAVVNVIINALLIPKFQAAGALIATIAAEGIVCVIQSIAVGRQINLLRCFWDNCFYLFTGVIMLCFVRGISTFVSCNSNLLNLIIQIVCGGILYTVMIVLHYMLYIKKKYDH